MRLLKVTERSCKGEKSGWLMRIQSSTQKGDSIRAIGMDDGKRKGMQGERRGGFDEMKPGWLYCFLRTAVPFSSIKMML